MGGGGSAFGVQAVERGLAGVEVGLQGKVKRGCLEIEGEEIAVEGDGDAVLVPGTVLVEEEENGEGLFQAGLRGEVEVKVFLEGKG